MFMSFKLIAFESLCLGLYILSIAHHSSPGLATARGSSRILQSISNDKSVNRDVFWISKFGRI